MHQPNPSLVKALLINSAKDLKDMIYQKKPIGLAPSTIQGHGLVDMQQTLAPVLGFTLNDL